MRGADHLAGHELAELAVGHRPRNGTRPRAEHRAMEAHLRGCADCREEVAALQAVAGGLIVAASPDAGTACLDDHLVAALADGSLDPDLHRSVLPHLRSCPACLAAVGSVSAALADPGIARELSALERPRSSPRPRRLYRFALPVAAAAVLLLAWPPPAVDDGLHRGGTVTAGSVPVPISPIDGASPDAALVWHPAAGADLYRVVLFHESGEVLYEHQTPDTTAALPPTVDLVPGRTYLWRIDARIGWDRWSSSDLHPFRVPDLDGR